MKEALFYMIITHSNIAFIMKRKSTLRISPDSTYKIYSALFALESNVISPEESKLSWDGTKQPYEAWNMDQDVYLLYKNL
ncbi:penicillin-binding transpeptidase domain-containing protein [Peribacillus frigoritolerans]|nr:penicillin-binding transpeptidase domain-containing protein [Peribacillus frigoritolerans]